MTATIPQMMDALALRLQTQLCGTVNPVIEQLQVDGRLIPNPSPPSIDVYPDEDFIESTGFGHNQKMYAFQVRARVGTSDNEAGQDLLLSMMDDEGTASVEAAIWADKTLGGVATVKTVIGPSAYGLFLIPGQVGTNLIGCTWRVTVQP